MPALEAYKRSLDYSYAPGMFPAMEAMKKAPHLVRRLLLSSKATEGEGVEKLTALAKENNIRIEVADKALSRISGKENCFAAAVFEKQPAALQGGDHVVLHHISDAGNLGTILRTALGLGFQDIAIIRPATDVYDPKVVRSSMGALFSLRVREYDDFDAYRTEFPEHQLYPFMLDGSVLLEEAAKDIIRPCALVMGNEGSGLPPAFAQMGRAVRIPHSNDIDSLNLAIATAIGMYTFKK